ncbi:hypothetical protein BO94DRAFT_620026 [Aspergillus sclerotioniger CBS 115572]|uniref:Uncharacterized protein n=1 Tax=Aspergillus sclerotioniger CBS 115572 TaxID=1450535 RepID=A0A317XAK0_9EURO|nr:hypothetical protein BO94DRAFT_620026 [Aspergillus sclerotioniger CBS 115572]PWY95616.1 hypothetical protein BO94DRAFT_620026 [Aspergillus sclerotioniger CBS 115572]
MSVIISSEIVKYDRLIPRTVEPEREDEDVEALVPWVFQNASFATEHCILDWPREESDFRDFFSYYCSYAADLDEQNRAGVTSVLKASEVITLPRRSWKAPQRDHFRHLIRSQSTMLKLLMNTVYLSIKDSIEQGPRVSFHKAEPRQKYVIGGKRYATQIEGAVTVDLQEEPVPILSFTGASSVHHNDYRWPHLVNYYLTCLVVRRTDLVRIPCRNFQCYVGAACQKCFCTGPQRRLQGPGGLCGWFSWASSSHFPWAFSSRYNISSALQGMF